MDVWFSHRRQCCLKTRPPFFSIPVGLLNFNTDPVPQVMRRAQSNSPRIPPKRYHSFRETRQVDYNSLLQLPGYKPRQRPRPPSYPAHVSPSRDLLNVPRIRVTCVPGYSDPPMRRQSPESSDRNPNSRGRSPSRRVSRRRNRRFGPSFPILKSVQTDSLTPPSGDISPFNL